MRRRRLFWQLFPTYLLITVVAVAAVAWYVSRFAKTFLLDEIAGDLEARARLVATQVAGPLAASDFDEVDRLCREFGDASGTRLTVILEPGRVVGDSDEDPDRMDSHANRPEIQDALAEGVGRSSRHSATLEENMMYVAVAIRENGGVHVVRASLPLTSIEQSLAVIHRRIAMGGLGVAFIAAAVCLMVSRAVSRPIEDMRRAAERLAAGDLKARAPASSSVEMCRLAETINRAAVELDARLRTIELQRNEHEAILASMSEGVLAVDTGEMVISVNRTAALMLDVAPREVVGLTMQEAVRNTELQKIVAEALTTSELVEGDVVLRDKEERFLRARGTLLHDAAGTRLGAVVVLTDVTRIRRLEDLRRDFVANVSHELKTPITSIKGFVETLLDGAIENRAEAERFLQIIARHADRLTAIINDLLVLSRIEQDSDRGTVELEERPLAGILRSALDVCSGRAARKQIPIGLACADNLTARVHAQLLEQATINLVDNAIKYSEPGKPVLIEAEAVDGEVLIHVRDQGCGIDRKHIPRLFERFYRIDKGRSRELGGTGLGLAIVKHIVQAHRGTVTVESEPGASSTFTIRLPRGAQGAAGS